MKTLKKIEEAFTKAAKAKDKRSMIVIRAIKTDLTNAKKRGEEISEESVIQCLKRQVKQRKESISQYEKYGRNDLSKVEKEEVLVIESLLPKQMTEEEVAVLAEVCILESGAESMRDMGGVMKLAKEKSKGLADNTILSQLIKQKLS